MAYRDKFAEYLANGGVPITVDDLPDDDTLKQAIDYLIQWFQSLPQWAQDGLDGATTNLNGSSYLAQPSVNIAPALADLMAKFDQATGWPLSTLLQWCQAAAQYAEQSAESETVQGGTT